MEDEKGEDQHDLVHELALSLHEKGQQSRSTSMKLVCRASDLFINVSYSCDTGLNLVQEELAWG